MRNSPNPRIEKYRTHGPYGENCGFFRIHRNDGDIGVMVSDGAGWDHVSVSLRLRTPTWEEMCIVKELFFKDDEVVMQLHVAAGDNVNNHAFCLHLWRPQTTAEIEEIRRKWGDEWPSDYPTTSQGTIPLPPSEFVGVKGLGTLVG